MNSRPNSQYFDAIKLYQNVFLTGASGYLGAYLLAELLDNSQAKVHCLVRGRGENISRMRLEIAMKEIGIWKPEYSSRIQVWSGDLEKPNFGLSPEQFSELRQSIQHIIHCAAKVSWTSTLASLEAVNVGSCRTILELSQGPKLIPISYISTIATLADDNGSLADGLDEDDPPSPSVRNMGGYIESKWTAEKLMIEARDRGAPIRIFRPGLICGPPSNGLIHREYFFFAIVKAMIESGKAFRCYNFWEITPVDYAARSILYLTAIPSPKMNTFHIMSSTGRTTIEIAEMMTYYGYPIEILDFDAWEKLMAEERELRPDHAFAHMKTLFEKDQSGRSFIENYMKLPMWFSFKTRKLLQEAGLTCEVLDHVTFRPYFDYMIQSGAIQTNVVPEIPKAIPLPELPTDKLVRHRKVLTKRPLPANRRPANPETVRVVNFKDALNPSDRWQDSLNVRILMDFSDVPSILTSLPEFKNAAQELSKNLYDLGRLVEDKDNQVIIVHATNGLEKNGQTSPLADLAVGFFKSLRREFQKTKIKFVLSDTPYEAMKDLLVEESTYDSRHIPAVYIQGIRHEWLAKATLEFEKDQPQRIRDGDVILFTGAGRGIGAYLAEHLSGLMPNLKMAIVGKSAVGKYADIIKAIRAQFGDLTQENYIKFLLLQAGGKIDVKAAVDEFQRVLAENELQGNLDKLAQKGISYQYYACDMDDSTSMKNTIAEIYKKFSRVDVVIHAAGAEKSKSIRQKPWKEFEMILNTKVMGFLNLVASLKMNEIRNWINFGSVSVWSGIAGLTDYSAANAFLNAVINPYISEFPNARFTTINWHGWSETGIVSRHKDVQATLAAQNIHLVDSASGLSFFLSEALIGKKEDSQVYYCSNKDVGFLSDD